MKSNNGLSEPAEERNWVFMCCPSMKLDEKLKSIAEKKSSMEVKLEASAIKREVTPMSDATNRPPKQMRLSKEIEAMGPQEAANWLDGKGNQLLAILESAKMKALGH